MLPPRSEDKFRETHLVDGWQVKSAWAQGRLRMSSQEPWRSRDMAAHDSKPHHAALHVEYLFVEECMDEHCRYTNQFAYLVKGARKIHENRCGIQDAQ